MKQCFGALKLFVIGVTIAISLFLVGAPLMAFPTFELISPYDTSLNVYRGQLHAHSTNSDGHESPSGVVTAYKNAGYDFVSLTDHDFVTPDPGISGILFIPGIEESEVGDHHIGRIGALTNDTSGVLQTIIDTGLKEGSFIELAHPNSSWGGLPNSWTFPLIESVTGYHAIEVWNATSTPNSHENIIDAVLSAGYKVSLLAVDDCHNTKGDSFNAGWVNVFANPLTTVSILNSLKRGNYYSSNGANISSINVDGDTITVSTDAASRIDFIGHNSVVKRSDTHSLSASYICDGSEVYIRVRITRDSDSKQAWANPVYIRQKPLDPVVLPAANVPSAVLPGYTTVIPPAPASEPLETSQNTSTPAPDTVVISATQPAASSQPVKRASNAATFYILRLVGSFIVTSIYYLFTFILSVIRH